MPSRDPVVETLKTDARDGSRAGLDFVFRPRSVAVVGASREVRSVGQRVLRNLIADGFQGAVFPVNPKADVVASIPAYPSVRDIPRRLDLAVISVPRDLVLKVVDDCIAKDVKGLVVLTAGFAEVGEEGRRVQDELVAKIRARGIRMVGPNCLGIVNTDPKVALNATFGSSHAFAGNVAMASQSGALGVAILEYARTLGLGLSMFVSMGNKADLSSNDLIEYWEDDSRTEVILLYLESFGNPRKFARIAGRVSRKKPILAVKGGRSASGQKAAGSHTASLKSSNEGTDALFRQTGVLRLDTLEEMFEVASVLAHQPLPTGPNVAILTNAGGPAILCADACEARGLALPALTPKTQARLQEFLPPSASVRNPVDMIAAAGVEEYRLALPALLDDDGIDSVIVLYIPAGEADEQVIAQAIRDGRAEARSGRRKPLLASFMSMRGMASPLSSADEAIPSFRFPESAARALARAFEYSKLRHRPAGVVQEFADLDAPSAVSACTRHLQSQGPGWLLAHEAEEILSAAGIDVQKSVVCRAPDEAARAAEALGYPVAVKLASRVIIHKSDVGGVKLDLTDRRQVHRAAEKIFEAASGQDPGCSVVVQRMCSQGIEIFVGMTLDPTFGPLIAFGLGGVAVELWKDVVFRMTPLSDQDAREMVRSIKGYPLLAGFRGSPPADEDAVIELLQRVSRLVEQVPAIREIDLNPVRVQPRGDGLVVLDAKLLL